MEPQRMRPQRMRRPQKINAPAPLGPFDDWSHPGSLPGDHPLRHLRAIAPPVPPDSPPWFGQPTDHPLAAHPPDPSGALGAATPIHRAIGVWWAVAHRWELRAIAPAAPGALRPQITARQNRDANTKWARPNRTAPNHRWKPTPDAFDWWLNLGNSLDAGCDKTTASE